MSFFRITYLVFCWKCGKVNKVYLYLEKIWKTARKSKALKNYVKKKKMQKICDKHALKVITVLIKLLVCCHIQFMSCVLCFVEFDLKCYGVNIFSMIGFLDRSGRSSRSLDWWSCATSELKCNILSLDNYFFIFYFLRLQLV